MEEHFIWPKNKILNALISAPKFIRVSSIEEKLRELFPTGYPVLCSSGRAAIVLALVESNVHRGSLVGTFPYASHCVLDAIARVATPLSGPTAKSALLRVVYHQWGYVQEIDLPNNTIEDCVDTLCVPGTTLFPGGGRFEIWSLPKILGTTSGGVLWCRDEQTALKIHDLRDKRGGGLVPWIIRLLARKYPRAYDYWQGAEVASGQISRLQTGEILSAILRWQEFVTDRKSKLKIVLPIVLNELPISETRLPAVVPVESDLSEDIIKSLGISSGYRMMERLKENKSYFIKTLPVPIHQNTSIMWLKNIVSQLDTRNIACI